MEIDNLGDSEVELIGVFGVLDDGDELAESVPELEEHFMPGDIDASDQFQLYGVRAMLK